MEIKFLNVSLKESNKYLIKNLNLKIESEVITGIYKDNNIIQKLLFENKDYQGKILINNKLFDRYEKKMIAYIGRINSNTFLTKKISDEFYLVQNNLKELKENFINKIIASLKMVGFNEFYLDKKICELSRSELIMLQIAIKLITNPDIIIIEEPFLYLDKNNKNLVKKILLNLKKNYKKTIIIISNNINLLYEFSNNLVIFKENKVLISDKVSTIFKDLSFLENNEIELPNNILFYNLALKSGIKLKNYKDINDLIKDVYRNVCEIKKET